MSCQEHDDFPLPPSQFAQSFTDIFGSTPDDIARALEIIKDETSQPLDSFLLAWGSAKHTQT